MNERLVVIRPSPNVMEIRHSVPRELLTAIIALIILLPGPVSVCSAVKSGRPWTREPWALALIVSALACYVLVRTIRLLRGKLSYVLDLDARVMRRKGSDDMPIDRIRNIEIETRYDSDYSDDYILKFALQDGSKIELAVTHQFEKLSVAAHEIARFLKLEVLLT